MSPGAPRDRVSRALAAALLGFYPEHWKLRYRDEMNALLDDDPPNARGLLTLLAGAADAHLRPQRGLQTVPTRDARMRVSVGGLFACWMLLSIGGVAFQKLTEEVQRAGAQSAHPPLAAGRDAILAGAALGACAVAFGGLPLLWHALRRAASERDVRLAALLALPALACAALAGALVLLAALAPARGGGFPSSFVLATTLPMTLAAIAFGLLCGLVPKAVLRRSQPGERALRRACRAGDALAVAIVLVAGGLALYAAALPLEAPQLAAQSSGPFGASTAATLALDLGWALPAAALGLLAARRGHRAAAA